jgi:protein phosphatase
VRVGIAVAGLLVLLALGGWLARSWVMQQYYVGTEAEQVVIYQGVRGSVLGVPLQTVAERTDITLSDLPEDARSTVAAGIPASNGLDGARGTVARLHSRMLPVCPTEQPAPATPTAPAPAAAGAAQPDPNVPPDPNAPPTDTTPLPTVTPEPGLTCRPAS